MMGLNNAVSGILANIGRKLDKDIGNIVDRLEEICDRLESIEAKMDSLEEGAPDKQTYGVDYSTEGAWTSTVLFKEREETEEG